MKILVVGGAGYVGSHTVLALSDAGHHVEVADNLTTGHTRLVPHGVPLHKVDAYHKKQMGPVLQAGFDAVMHFAALSLVAESMSNPRRYFESNVSGGLALIESCLDAGVKRFILSSSASAYGVPEHIPIREDARIQPLNPYGRTKVALEYILESFHVAYGLDYLALRYFNAAGADENSRSGEVHDPETHLIPNVLKAALADRPVSVFGLDYPTRDGTCIRDYVHVSDLAQAHVLGIEALAAGCRSGAMNLGSNEGTSVLEIVESAQRVTGHDIRIDKCPRRPGDPPVLIADPSRAKAELGWKPKFTSVDNMVRTAWNWHQRDVSQLSLSTPSV